MQLYGGLFEPRGSKLTLLKSMFNAENFIHRLSWSISLSPVISAQFRLEMCAAASNCKKCTKNSYLWSLKVVQGRSRSSVLVSEESTSAVLAMIGSKSVSICNRSLARRTNSGKIKIS